MGKKANQFYIKTRMNADLAKAINTVDSWRKIENTTEVIYRGEIQYQPFKRAHRDSKDTEPLQTYRLVVSKIERKDK